MVKGNVPCPLLFDMITCARSFPCAFPVPFLPLPRMPISQMPPLWTCQRDPVAKRSHPAEYPSLLQQMIAVFLQLFDSKKHTNCSMTAGYSQSQSHSLLFCITSLWPPLHTHVLSVIMIKVLTFEEDADVVFGTTKWQTTKSNEC